MHQISKQELALMNAEMAARILLHIAIESPAQNRLARSALTLEELQALQADTETSSADKAPGDDACGAR
jgi:hypothetical protein